MIAPAVHPALFDPGRTAPIERARLATLAAIASHEELRQDYVLKGGLVLERIYGCPRPSSDLDFDHVGGHTNAITPAHRARLQAFADRVADALPPFAAPYALWRLRLRIDTWSDELPVLFMLVDFEADGGASGSVASGSVEVQATLSETVCRTVRARIGGVEVQACSLADVVADKLKALLQQTRRHQVRHADVYDLWYALEAAPFVVAPADVGPCLRRKVASWPDLLPLTAARFADGAVRSFAEAGYRKLRSEQPDLPFPPFDTVWASILAFVERLGLEEA